MNNILLIAAAATLLYGLTSKDGDALGYCVITGIVLGYIGLATW